MPDAVHVEPDPFDKVVDELLADPEVRASIEEQVAALARGELATISHAEVRERMRQRGVPLDDRPAEA